LRFGQNFSYSWFRGDRPLGTIDVVSSGDALVLLWRAPGVGKEARPIEQQVPIVWTRCHFGGARPWFQCAGQADGRRCGRRAARLYLAGGSIFACRLCHGLAYASQSETPGQRAITKAQKFRVRLGGGPSLLDRFPRKPPRMHRRTYFRLFAKAIKAQERALDLEIDKVRRRFPGPSTEGRGFSPTKDAVWAGEAEREVVHAGVAYERGTLAAGM
jgi:hypothetical protein